MNFEKMAKAAISDAEAFAGNDYVANRWLSKAKYWALAAAEDGDNECWKFALMRAVCSLESSLGTKSPITVLYSTWCNQNFGAPRRA